MQNGAPISIYAILLGAARYTNDYHGVRRGPNAAFEAYPAMGPNSGSIKLVAKTANGVGISARSEVVVNYGIDYDLATPSKVNADDETEKRFKAHLGRDSAHLHSKSVFLHTIHVFFFCNITYLYY